MAIRTVVLLLVQLLYLVFCCSGELVLYVQSNGNETACPNGTDPTVNCTLLSEYATDPSLSLDLNTTLKFVFLPGEHVLDTKLYVYNVSALELRSEIDNTAVITCTRNGGIYIEGLDRVEVSFLNFSSSELHTSFVGNTVIRHCHFSYGRYYVATILEFYEGLSTVEYCTFEHNRARLVTVYKGLLYFRRNQITHNHDKWMELWDSSSTTLSDNCFVNNNRSVGVFIRSSSLRLTGTNVFRDNSGVFAQGILHCVTCTIVLEGNATFANNTGTVSGVLTGSKLKLYVKSNVHFVRNVGINGGTMVAYSSQLYFSGNTRFDDNRAVYGGAIFLVSSTVIFLDGANVTFAKNLADYGGAFYLTSGSSLHFPSTSSAAVTFEQNHAETRGGAIFVQDCNAQSYCQAEGRVTEYFGPVQDCSFLFDDIANEASLPDNLYFYNNWAEEAGSAIYGGSIGFCTPNVKAYSPTDEFFRQRVLGNISNATDFTASVISSDPFVLYACDGSTPTCTDCSISRTAYPGATVNVTVVALGQMGGAVPATIRAITTQMEIGDLEYRQGIPKQCTTVSYTVYARPGNVSLELFADGPCLRSGQKLMVEIEVFNCPPGFKETAIGDQVACTCDPRLSGYTNSCNPQNGEILRDGKFWVGYDQELEGLILYSSCPFDYCITDEISFKVEDSDVQCNNNREGILCGQCSDGLSIVLGSSRCERCSDSYLALLLFFATAGVILVAFLLLLNLTVAAGTINGLIFYANIVAANEALIFPSNSSTYLDILRVFIAWINLDFGIESCFSDGMDEYALTWLQYAFPLYLWILVGLVFIVSHFSSRVSRILGSNPVTVLATLILLSYTKVLRTLIEAFSAASLDYPQGETQTVWMKDGNVPFLDVSDGRHLGLFIASLLFLVTLFIPYTLLLLTSQWLQIKSHWKILSWLNKPQLRAFLDAYHAPYKPRHRYWTGLLLIIRFALQLTAALGSLRNPLVTFLVIQIFVLLVLMWAWSNGGIYKKWYLNMLEAFFFLNLGVLAASTHHINSQFTSLSSREDQRSQVAATSTLVTLALIAFNGIVIFHGYLLFKGIRAKLVHAMHSIHDFTKVKRKTAELPVPSSIQFETDPFKSRKIPTRSFVDLRESVLDDQEFGN